MNDYDQFLLKSIEKAKNKKIFTKSQRKLFFKLEKIPFDGSMRTHYMVCKNLPHSSQTHLFEVAFRILPKHCLSERNHWNFQDSQVLEFCFILACHLNPGDFYLLFKSFSDNWNVEGLDISLLGMFKGFSGATCNGKVMCSALRVFMSKNTSLKILNLNGRGMISHNVDANLFDDGLLAFAEGFNELSTLRVLSLARCNLTENGSRALGILLTKLYACKTLKLARLSLQDHPLDFTYIADGFTKRTLRNVHLSMLKFTSGSAKILAEWFRGDEFAGTAFVQYFI